VGPDQPVDGDSVASTKAVIDHLRKLGLEAYTLPTIHMYPQLAWILSASDIHPACLPFASAGLTVYDLQKVYDELIAVWRPDEIVLVDGQSDRLGFDPRGIKIYTIDHHMGRGARDDEGAYIQPAPSAGSLLIEHFGIYEMILVVSILTDTFWLRKNMPARAIDALYALRQHGLTDEVLATIQSKLMVPKSPKVLEALRSCDLRYEDRTVFAALNGSDPEVHREVVAFLGYYFCNLCVARGDGYVSFSTKDATKSVLPLAVKCGGGGHTNSAAGHLRSTAPAALSDLHDQFMAEFGDSSSRVC
jgi:nanoRNase/pAp phosphatase (c-di-AMP/oligoRNAs hydrolase)